MALVSHFVKEKLSFLLLGQWLIFLLSLPFAFFLLSFGFATATRLVIQVRQVVTLISLVLIETGRAHRVGQVPRVLLQHKVLNLLLLTLLHGLFLPRLYLLLSLLPLKIDQAPMQLRVVCDLRRCRPP